MVTPPEGVMMKTGDRNGIGSAAQESRNALGFLAAMPEGSSGFSYLSK